jgi:hypothetical protein
MIGKPGLVIRFPPVIKELLYSPHRPRKVTRVILLFEFVLQRKDKS